MALRIALGNNKGGTGKTSATINLAAGLAEQGRRVLVVDMDPQSNSGRRLGFRFSEQDPVPTISEAIKSGEAGVAADAITAIGWPEPYADRIALIPSRYDLENRISEAAVLGAMSRLRKVLQDVDDDYDFTLIDCPPSLGHLTQMALAAANAAVCTLEPEYDAVEAAIRFRDFIDAQAAELKNPSLEVIGYIINRSRPNVGAHAYQLEGLADLFGDRVWQPHIPERAAIKDAGDAAVPLRVLGGRPALEVADLYADIAKRLLDVTA